MNRIIDASGYSGTTLVASKGIDVIMQQTDEHGHSHQDHDAHSAVDGVADPHAWTSLRQAIYYLENISSELVRLRPDSSAYFEDRKATYIDQIKQLDARAMALFSGLEDARKNIVIPHNSFAYLAKDYGFSV